MMKSIKRVRREAKHLFRLCHVNGSLDEDQARRVVQHILASKRRGYLALATHFQRLVRLEQLRHTRQVESDLPWSPDFKGNIRLSLVRIYSPP